RDLADAGFKLLGEGDHYGIKGLELPFGQQGIENMTRLFGRFMDALPDELKEKIAEAAAKFGAKAGLKSVPLLGSIVSGISAIDSVKDLIAEVRKEPRDALAIALAAGQAGLDIAGIFPGLGAITGPLQVVLGTAQ